MLPALLFGIGLVVVMMLFLNWYSKAEVKELKRNLLWMAVALLGVLVVGLALTGRLGLAIGGIAAMVPFVRRLWGFYQMAQMFKRFRQGGNFGGFGGRGGQGRSRAYTDAGDGGPMTEDKALKILGLQKGASREEIQKAYKEMMAKVHPDTGGSDHLAAQVNAAKEFLLGD